MKHVTRITRAAALAAGVALLPGCVAAAGAAAGVGAVTYINDQTATTQVDANVSTTTGWTESAFRDMSIEITKREIESDAVELTGKSPDGLDVKASVQKEGDLTRIKVTAKRNMVNYDKSYARNVVEKILAYAG